MLFSPIMTPPPYLDPGSGSILIQMIVAAILGAGVLIRSQWARIKKWFGKSEDEQVEDETKDADE